MPLFRLLVSNRFALSISIHKCAVFFFFLCMTPCGLLISTDENSEVNLRASMQKVERGSYSSLIAVFSMIKIRIETWACVGHE